MRSAKAKIRPGGDLKLKLLQALVTHPQTRPRDSGFSTCSSIIPLIFFPCLYPFLPRDVPIVSPSYSLYGFILFWRKFTIPAKRVLFTYFQSIPIFPMPIIIPSISHVWFHILFIYPRDIPIISPSYPYYIFLFPLPSGKLTWLWKITIFDG